MQNTPSNGKHSRLHIASIFWGVLCLFLILSCAGRHSYPADLAMADTLCRTNPDSAVAYVKSISKKYANSSNPYDRNYYQLLTVKAANNVYKPLKDSTIFRVMDFYEKANDTEKLCQTYYYVGKHFVQENDAPQALQYFQKALDLTDENTPLSFLSCIYSQTGSLFLYQEMYDDALTMYKKSYSCDSLLRDTVNMLYSMQDIADMAGITRQAVALRLRRKGISAKKKEPTTPTTRHYSMDEQEKRLYALQHIKDVKRLTDLANKQYEDYLKTRCEIDRVLAILNQSKRNKVITAEELVEVKGYANSGKPLKRDVKAEKSAE